MRGSTTNWTRSCGGTSRSRRRVERKRRRRGPRAVDMAGITVAAMSCCEMGPCSSRTWDMLRRAGGRGRRRARRASSESPAVPGIAGARDVRTRAYAQADPVEGRHAPHLAGPTDDGLTPGGGGSRRRRASADAARRAGSRARGSPRSRRRPSTRNLRARRRSRARDDLGARSARRAPPDGARRASGRRAVAEDGRHELVNARVFETCGRGRGSGRGPRGAGARRRCGRPGRSGGATGAPRGPGRARARAKFERTRRVRAAVAEPHHLRDVGGGQTLGLVLELQFRPDSGIIFEDLVDLVHALSEASQERRRGGGNLGRNPHGDARRLRGLGHPSRPAVVLAPGPAPPLIPGRPRAHLVFKSSAVPAAPGVGGERSCEHEREKSK